MFNELILNLKLNCPFGILLLLVGLLCWPAQSIALEYKVVPAPEDFIAVHCTDDALAAGIAVTDEKAVLGLYNKASEKFKKAHALHDEHIYVQDQSGSVLSGILVSSDGLGGWLYDTFIGTIDGFFYDIPDVHPGDKVSKYTPETADNGLTLFQERHPLPSKSYARNYYVHIPQSGESRFVRGLDPTCNQNIDQCTKSISINSKGQVVGVSKKDINGSTDLPFLYDLKKDKALALELPAGTTEGIAYDINDQSMTVGLTYTGYQKNELLTFWQGTKIIKTVPIPDGLVAGANSQKWMFITKEGIFLRLSGAGSAYSGTYFFDTKKNTFTDVDDLVDNTKYSLSRIKCASPSADMLFITGAKGDVVLKRSK